MTHYLRYDDISYYRFRSFVFESVKEVFLEMRIYGCWRENKNTNVAVSEKYIRIGVSTTLSDLTGSAEPGCFSVLSPHLNDKRKCSPHSLPYPDIFSSSYYITQHNVEGMRHSIITVPTTFAYSVYFTTVTYNNIFIRQLECCLIQQ